jgi:hypothetical protein
MNTDKFHSMNPPRPPRKRVPTGGVWLFTSHLPVGTTDEQMREFYLSVGLDIPVEHISPANGDRPGNALVSVPYDVVEMLVNWAINGARMNGHVMDLRLPQACHRGESPSG